MSRLFVAILLLGGKIVFADCIPLDIETAWQRVQAYAPSVASANAEIDAKLAERKQVALLPNPVVVVEADNLGVRTPDDEVDPPETTVAISQLIELGGKRKARARFASTLAEIAYWDSQIERYNLHFALMIAFINVSMAQEKLRLMQEQVKLADEFFQTLGTQAYAGKISAIQKRKAFLAQMRVQVSAKEALSEFEQAKKRLASLWGCSVPDFESVTFELFECKAPPCCELCIHEICQTPDFERARAMIFSATQNLELQKANGIPDVVLKVGCSIFNESSQHGWVIGAEMPLPFFDRNQGNIRKACIAKTQAEYQMDEVERKLQEQILVVHNRLMTAYENSEYVCNEILSEAAETVSLIETGYLKGKIEYLELLEAQKMLFEVQEKYIEILYDYHLNRAELERLTGKYI